MLNQTITNNFEKKSLIIDGYGSGALLNYNNNKFRDGTQYVKLLVLNNYGGLAENALFTMRNVSLKEIK